ncbi:MAG: AarF/UbiB family protein [Anaerolineae bacterium]|nr:AarF/UbiB family protein [Anaerolineae bacterium]
MQNSSTQPFTSASPRSSSSPKADPLPAPDKITATSTDGMVTGIYGATDRLRGAMTDGMKRAETAKLKPEAAPTTAPAPQAGRTVTAGSVVPADIDAVPRGRSLAMQWRFLNVLVWAAQLFIRVIFWQIYARKVVPGYVERTNPQRWVRYARQFRRFALARTGLFIKLGQFISTRVDALPESIIRELESLQDEVPTEPFPRMRKLVERELGAIDQRYAWFDEKPIGAASLGQAYRAKLQSGERVVVKVQRPGIRNVCYTDIVALKIIAAVADRFAFVKRRANTPALVREFGQVVLQELSYLNEANNAHQFGQMFAKDHGVYIPEVYTDHSTDTVLTMEDVTSIKISDFAALEAAGISRKTVAERLMDTYLKQIFEAFFFHADPHPGNLFIYPLPVDDVQKYVKAGGGRPFYLIFVDFGMTGTLTREIADGIVDTLTAIIARDSRKLIQSYNKLGFILPGADLKRIEEAARAAFDEVWGLSMTEIRDMDYERAANLAGEFSDLIKSMPFYLPQDFIYLGRTVSILSGMCTQLDPTFNPWKELEPYAQRLAAQGFGAQIGMSGEALSGWELVRATLSGGRLLGLASQAITSRIPVIKNGSSVLSTMDAGELQVVSEPSIAYKAQLRKLEAAQNRTSRAVVFTGILVASTLLFTAGYTPIAVAGYAYCSVSAIWGTLRG